MWFGEYYTSFPTDDIRSLLMGLLRPLVGLCRMVMMAVAAAGGGARLRRALAKSAKHLNEEAEASKQTTAQANGTLLRHTRRRQRCLLMAMMVTRHPALCLKTSILME